MILIIGRAKKLTSSASFLPLLTVGLKRLVACTLVGSTPRICEIVEHQLGVYAGSVQGIGHATTDEAITIFCLKLCAGPYAQG